MLGRNVEEIVRVVPQIRHVVTSAGGSLTRRREVVDDHPRVEKNAAAAAKSQGKVGLVADCSSTIEVHVESDVGESFAKVRGIPPLQVRHRNRINESCVGTCPTRGQSREAPVPSATGSRDKSRHRTRTVTPYDRRLCSDTVVVRRARDADGTRMGKDALYLGQPARARHSIIVEYCHDIGGARAGGRLEGRQVTGFKHMDDAGPSSRSGNSALLIIGAKYNDYLARSPPHRPDPSNASAESVRPTE
jgi:hypothetical protein